jgi:hypothetical protein
MRLLEEILYLSVGPGNKKALKGWPFCTKRCWAASTAGSARVFYAGIVARRHTPIVGDGTLLKTPQKQNDLMARGKRTNPTAVVLAEVMHEMSFPPGLIAELSEIPRKTVDECGTRESPRDGAKDG